MNEMSRQRFEYLENKKCFKGERKIAKNCLRPDSAPFHWGHNSFEQKFNSEVIPAGNTHQLHKKWSFPLRISPVNVTKYAVSCGFGYIYWRNPYWKTSFFVQCQLSRRGKHSLMWDHRVHKFFSQVLTSLIRRQSCHHIETSQLICKANQLTGFYMMATYAFNELMAGNQTL